MESHPLPDHGFLSPSSSSLHYPSSAFHSTLQSPAASPLSSGVSGSASPPPATCLKLGTTSGSFFPDSDFPSLSHNKKGFDGYAFSSTEASSTLSGCDLDGSREDIPELQRIKSCDVFIGLCGRSPSLLRFVNWLRSELELQGVFCFVSDRTRCSDARAHSTARAVMETATLGVVMVTRRTFSNPYSMEEVKMFLERKNLMPIFFGLAQGDCIVRDIVERRGELWERRGGFLWTAYGGLEEEWREAVNGLSRLDFKLEAHVGNWRDCISEAVLFVGTRLGRRSVVERIKKWKEWVENEEYPFLRNEGFIGRKKELLELELRLFGYVEVGGGSESFELKDCCIRGSNSIATGASEQLLAGQSQAREGKGKESMSWKETEEHIEVHGVWSEKLQRHLSKMTKVRKRTFSSGQYRKGFACVSGDSGIGKTELLLEFAYRFSQRYKMVLWIGGEVRYFCQNYMNLLPKLGIDVGLENEGCQEKNGPRSFGELEEQAIFRVRKELMRDIPFLVVIDNLEAEKDWWSGRSIVEFLPRFGGKTHIIISTRMPQVMNIEPMRLLYLSGSEAMSLMKGNLRDLPTEEVDALKAIEEKLDRITLGLSIVRAVLTELPISPEELLDAITKMPHRDIKWSGKEDLVLRINPFLLQLLDFCLSILDLNDKHKNLTSRMVQASGWFAPLPIPGTLLALAVSEASEKSNDGNLWKRIMHRIACMFTSSHGRRSESEAYAMLIRLQIARSSTKEGYIHFHDIIRMYARKTGNARTVHAMVRAINTKGSLPHHCDHIWAACFLIFKFGTDPAVVDLKISELIAFIKRLVLPMALETFTAFNCCSASLELLRLSTEKLEAMDDTFLSEAKRELERPSCWCTSTGQSSTLIDPLIYQEFALLRATLLETRAKLMLRGGLYDIGERLCRSAVNIKEVFYGEEHPEMETTRETLKRLARLKLKF